MEHRDLEWGENKDGKEYAIGLRCPNGECEESNSRDMKYFSSEYVASMAVGVRFQGIKERRPYVLSCECPKCFTKFWFHITEDYAKEIVEDRSKSKSTD